MSKPTRRSVLRAGALTAAGTAGFAASGRAAGASAAPRRAGQLRVLTWNIYRGGTGAAPDNLPKLLDQLMALRPDIYLAVETYGAGKKIRRALSERAGNGEYAGVQITDAAPGSDNLWIFTHLPIVQVHPKPTGGALITDFNLGGVRVRLPGGPELDAFVFWSSYTDPWDGYLIDENAAGIRAGLEPRHSAAEVVDAGRRQTAYVKEVVHQHLPAMLGDSSRPVVIGGDFNTLPAEDWAPANAGKPNHLGMSYDLTATPVLTDDGFVDTFRAGYPDVAVEGRTWCPLPTERMITPQRIDVIYAKGDVTVAGAATVDTRMPQHGQGTFYSDHAAVLTDLQVS